MSDGIFVSIRAEELLARLTAAPDRLRDSMWRVMQRLSIEAQAIVKQKLSGPVLHNRTGTLRRSINRLVTNDVNGIVARIGTNVRYAAVHEYGFDGDVVVKGHVRKIASRSVGKGKNQTVQGIAFVSTYTRHMTMPERSFLRSTIIEMQPKIRADIKAAALEALK